MARRAALIVGVLGLGIAFIFSYVGAFHHPTPHRVSLAVVAPPQQAGRLVAQLNALPGGPLRAHAAPDAASARSEVRRDDVAAALIVNPRSSRDRLLVASGGGAALSTAVEGVLTKVEARQHRTLDVRDLVPLQAGDYRGLTGFYAVVGWLVCGYLLAALLAITDSSRVTSLRRVGGRLALVGGYAIAAGLGGTLVIDTLLGAQTGHFLALAGVGALVVFAAGAVTIALEELVGIVGIGLAILLLVVLGNPSAGGAYQLPLLPGFWRAIGNALPNGAAVDAIRRIVYYDGHGLTGRLLVLGAWCLGSLLVALAVAGVRGRRREAPAGVATPADPATAVEPHGG